MTKPVIATCENMVVNRRRWDNGGDLLEEKKEQDWFPEAKIYHNGSHLDGMNVRYATDKNWANGIGLIMKDFVKEFKEINSI